MSVQEGRLCFCRRETVFPVSSEWEHRRVGEPSSGCLGQMFSITNIRTSQRYSALTVWSRRRINTEKPCERQRRPPVCPQLISWPDVPSPVLFLCCSCWCNSCLLWWSSTWTNFGSYWTFWWRSSETPTQCCLCFWVRKCRCSNTSDHKNTCSSDADDDLVM